MNKLNAITLAIATVCSGVAIANNLPTNEKVTSGTATFERGTDKMTINQSTDRVSIDWDSFDIGKGNTVEFVQPKDTSIAYNRVTGGNASEIQGQLKANGRVFLANPNGVIFGKDSQVNVGALLATTKVVDGANIDGSTLRFIRHKKDEGKVEVHKGGKITSKGENGFIVLVGDNVENNGNIDAKHYYKSEKKTKRECYWDCFSDPWSGWTGANPKYREKEEEIITATQSQAILASGESFDLELADSDITVSVDANNLAGIVTNNGAIVAKNGYIELTVAGEDELLKNAVNNNGLLEASEMSEQSSSGKITLSAKNTHLGEKSRIKAEQELIFTSPDRRLDKEVNLTSAQGSTITAKKTKFDVSKKLSVSGKFDREEFVAEGITMFKKEQGKQNNQLEITLPTADLTVANNNDGNPFFISSDALSSMLNTHGTVSLNTNTFTLNDDLNLNSHKQADSYLRLTFSKNAHLNGNISSPNNRLNIVLEPGYFGSGQSIQINSPVFDLGGGSLVASKTGRWYVGDPKISYAEEDARNPFSVSLKNVTLKNIGDFAVVGSDNVSFDNVQHNGNMNLYIHGGNKRSGYKNSTVYEYGFKNLDERVDRTEKGYPARRWKYNYELDKLSLSREFHDVFDMWTVDQNRQHLDTTINIRNSNIKTSDGFIHLMAKNLNMENSRFDVTFDRDLSQDSYALAINKVGINAQNAVLDNSHIRVEGAEKAGVSPSPKHGGGVAGFYFIGNMVGKNNSSIFTKTHQGFAFHTEGDTTFKGEKTADDLKITAITTGSKPAPEIGMTSSDNDANANNVAIGLGDTARTKTVFENTNVTALSPNGGRAYVSHDGVKLEVSGGNFTYYEQPRGDNYNNLTGTLFGDKNHITSLSARQGARALDSAQGIVATTLSATQSRLPENHKSMTEETPSIEMTGEKTVTIEVCDKPNNCTLQSIGDRHSASKVVVGEIM